jgi:UDP-N-acetylmuramate dehydrogenase
MKPFIRDNFNLAPITWLKVGGPAELFFMPKSLEELQDFVRENKGKKFTILGASSNSLILQGGIKGIIIKTTNLNKITLLENYTIKVESGVLDKILSQFAAKNSIGGLEFLDSIPGTIGGNIRTNAGCYGREIADILLQCQCLTLDGDLITLKKEDLKFSYRSSILPENILMVTSVILQGYHDSIANITTKMLTMEKNRKKTQPTGISTCGSTFKNGEKDKAWKLIKESGAADLEFNGVKMSDLHCNFLDNKSTKANDVYHFCLMVQNKVREYSGINLEMEIFVLGDLE